jgi:cytochrome c oxidase assembly protein subunit 15
MYRIFLKTSLILVYLVIIAGAVVRMTGSGMGCPDWPKCFGYYIPPTEEAELQFQPNRFYEEGQVIIVDESLRVASKDFTSKTTYNEANWSTYDRHDYAIFNPWHTWIEYVNRLLGALAGLAMLIMTGLSFKYWQKEKHITIVTIVSLILMCIQGYLGAKVVYSLLAPVKITIHMVMALVIVAVLNYLVHATSKRRIAHFKRSVFQNLLILSILFTLIQIILGTQVRQFVDNQIDIVGYAAKASWLKDPTISFYIHRTFSVIVVLVNAMLWWQNKKLGYGFQKLNWVMVLIGIEILSGIAMYYIDFPFGTQPLHLVIATVLFGVQSFILMECLKATKLPKTATS